MTIQLDAQSIIAIGWSTAAIISAIGIATTVGSILGGLKPIISAVAAVILATAEWIKSKCK